MTLALSRRRLLQSVALVGLSACSTDGGRVTKAGSTTVTTRRAAPDAAAALRRRLERATFGVTDALMVEVDSAGGFEAWLDAQLTPDSLGPVPAADELLGAIESRLPDLGTLRFETQQERAEATRLCLQTVTGRTVFGAAFGPDQLRQRVVDVLADLLHVTSSEQPEVFGVPDYDRVLRAGAFGRFADLVVATARHPAMLVFLDQATSRADGGRVPNENYARELMELHTLGVDGGYDEGDVAELAHVLTGWSVERRTRSYVYRPEWHDLGPFTTTGDILGWRPGAGEVGEAAGVAAIEHLAAHPSTARRIAHLLARRFVSESIERDDELVVDAAAVYQDNDTAIGPVVRHLLTSDRFAEAATLMVRRPIDLVAHVVRVTGATADTADLEAPLRSLVGLLRVLGQVPYGWPAPNGYPFGSAAWSNAGAMIGRWNGMVTMVGAGAADDAGARPAARIGLRLDPASLGAADPEELVAVLCGPDHQVY